MGVFVVDSSDRDRIEDAQVELHRIVCDDAFPRNAALLVFANKQDLPGALGAASLIEKLRLPELPGREWYVQPACATSGDGLHEGLDWLANALEKRLGVSTPFVTLYKARFVSTFVPRASVSRACSTSWPIVQSARQEEEVFSGDFVLL